jgi:quaternary ammonium compound-resistance protein SugE
MAWVMLLVAGLLEVVWALALKGSDGLSPREPATLVFVVAAALSFWLLAGALRHLPVGTAYAVWTGIGAVGAAIAGVILLGEPATASRLAAIGVIAAGIAWLAAVSHA